jgi:hypothetical protein
MVESDVFEAYYTYNEALVDIALLSDQQDLDGNYSRIHEKALRVAGLLAAIQGSKTVTIRHWARAQQIAEGWRRNLHNMYQSLCGTIAVSTKRNMEDAIVNLLGRSDSGATKREIVKGIRGLSSSDADELLPRMVSSDLIVETVDGKTKRYWLSPEPTDD